MAKQIDAKGKFSKDQNAVPFGSNVSDPMPTRNIYALFDGGGQDLFKHGLSELQPFVGGDGNNFTSDDKQRIDSFKQTVDYSPFIKDNGSKSAKEDPVMFGFDFIIRTEESPLFSSVLEDSVDKFLKSGIVSNDEMVSRVKVHEDFKKSFFQFFRSSLETKPSLTSTGDNPTNSRFYYYLNKVTGLDALVESNTGDTFKSFIDYGKDTIKLEFTEDVTLRVGRMAALYKSLYWSRTHGKTLIPENLLRFDCDIIVSEVRNFVTLKNVADSDPLGGLQILKDNMNRYVYTLYDCQLFFDKMAHGDSIDLSAVPTEYTGYSVGFTYKHSTLRVDEFNPEAEIYNILNNGSDDPNSFSGFDKFLSTSTNISATSSGIPESQIAKTPQIIINTIKTNDNQTSGVSDDKAKILNDEKTDYINTNDGYGLLNDKRWGRPAIYNLYTNHTNNFAYNSNGAANVNEKDVKSSDNISYQNQIIYEQSNPWLKTGLSTNHPINRFTTNEESLAAGQGKKDVIRENPFKTAGKKLIKNIVNTGIAVVNQELAKRTALINKTLGNLTKGSGFGEILPPKNIYEKDFNGERYLASKLVRNALENFVGESVSSLFTNRKFKPNTRG